MAKPPCKPYAMRASDIQYAADWDLGGDVGQEAGRRRSGGLISRAEKTVAVDVGRLLQFARDHDVMLTTSSLP